MRTRAVQLLVNEALPPELRNYERPLDARDVGDLMHKVALSSPGAYASILKRIGDIGRNAAYWQGESMGLDDLEDIIDVKPMIKEMHAEVAAATRGMQDPKEKRKTRETIWLKWSTKIERAAMEAGKLKRNSVADSVVSGARGKPLQLRAMLATPGVFENNTGGIVPVFAERSYSRGVSPAEWLAGTFGARSSVVSTKRATARGGFWGKMLVQVAAPLVVTAEDCGTSNGIDLDPDDSSLRNRFLAQGIGKLPGGVQIDRKVLAEIRNNHKPVIVRSAMTCEAKKGVCAKCLGAMPNGSLAPKGYAAGVTAAQALSEPVTQGGLNCLVLGTLVRMADFSVRKIEDIKVNEMVLGADVHGNTFPVRVAAVWDQGIQPVWNYTYQDADGWVSTVESTTRHEILGVTQAHDIAFKLQPDTPDLQALITSGLGDLRRAPQVSKVFMGGKECRDLSVQHPDELFVLANGLIVSNTKHVSGTAKEKKSYSGIEWLERFVQVPDNFPDRAPLAETEGRVLVEPAPQGGNYVKIGDRTHYVPQHLEVKVKSGDMVEAGDVLSDGIVRPDDVVRLRGIGEGRRYYAARLKQMLDDGGTKADARNSEVLARAAVDHVRVADFDNFDEGVLPDDIVPYEKTLGRDLPEDAANTDPEKAVGKYLYRPALHYTVGTKLTPKMSQHLKKVGIGAVTASAKPPGFEPTMQRLQTQSFANDDWLASMHTSYLGKQLAQGAQRAQDTNIRKNIHFAPRLAFGENFGTNIEQTGEF